MPQFFVFAPIDVWDRDLFLSELLPEEVVNFLGFIEKTPRITSKRHCPHRAERFVTSIGFRPNISQQKLFLLNLEWDTVCKHGVCEGPNLLDSVCYPVHVKDRGSHTTGSSTNMYHKLFGNKPKNPSAVPSHSAIPRIVCSSVYDLDLTSIVLRKFLGCYSMD